MSELHKALSAFQSEVTNPVKNISNTFFKSKYADLGSCIDVMRPLLSKHGLSFTQLTEMKEGQLVLVTSLRHSAGEQVDGFYPINPTKNDPQGMGSALTYARRYALCAMFGLAAEDDHDGNAASAPTKKAEKAAEKTPEQRAKEATEDYISKIHAAKTSEVLEAIMDKVDSGKLSAAFPDFYQSIVDEFQAQSDLIARSNHVENTINQIENKELK